MDELYNFTSTFELDKSAAVDLLVLALIGLWKPVTKGGHMLTEFQRSVIVYLCTFSTFIVWYSHPGTQFHSTLAMLCSATLAIRTASFRSTSNIASLLHALWSVRLILLSDTKIAPTQLTCFAIHLLLAFILLSPTVKHQLRRHVRGFLFLDIIAFLRLCTERQVTMEDTWDPEYCKHQLDLVKRLKFDTTKRLFVVRAILAQFWKPWLAITLTCTLVSVARLSKSVVVSWIVKAVDASGDTGRGEVYFLFTLWLALSLSSLVDKYMAVLRASLKDSMATALKGKFLVIIKSQKSLEYRLFDINKVVWTIPNDLAAVISDSSSLISNILANSFTIGVLASTIGWRTAIPLVISVVHLVISHVVTSNIDRLEKLSKRHQQPHLGSGIHSLLHNMRTIKFYGWECAFRYIQDNYISGTFVPPIGWRLLNYITSLAGSSLPQISAALTVSSFLSTADSIEYADLLVIISSTESLSSFISMLSSISGIVKKVHDATEELEKLLRMDDYRFIERRDDTNDVAVSMDSCSFQWNTGEFVLNDIRIRINKGEFAVIVGRIGSGKSSLLSAICSEMPIIGGTGLVSGKIGYVSQKPWIMNATVRDNVLFGSSYDEKFYSAVLDACALTEDIKQFQAQDMTEIGHRGINLSGGQKVRLALARAIYSRADIFILDDLLAAVDAHVERHLIENVLVGERGIISSKTRILVTHAEHIVPLADKVVTLVSGRATVEDQTPIQLDSNVVASVEDEQPAISENLSAGSSQFTYDPERGKEVQLLSLLWCFIKFSGISAVGPSVVIYLASTYAVYRIESIRMDMLLDNNRDTMVSSLQHYLFVSAMVSLARSQIHTVGELARIHFWSKKVYKKTRTGVLDSLLGMPLVLFESLPTEPLLYLWGYDRTSTGYHLPSMICSQILVLMEFVSIIIQVYARLPILLLYVVPIALIAYKVRKVAKLARKYGSPIADSRGLDDPFVLYSEINAGGYVMRIQGMLCAFLQKFQVGQVIDSRLGIYYTAGTDLQEWLQGVCEVVISSTALLLTVRRCMDPHSLIAPGSVEMVMRLTTLFLSGISSMVSLEGGVGYPLSNFSRYTIYTDLPLEPSSDTSVVLPSEWPSDGTIKFCDYSMRYRESQDLVLKNVSFSVRRRERVGIVGRTGAGKSSLTFALMRIIEPASGAIFIGGVDIAKIGLQDLRSKISIIPQDPALFVGTIRENLDPLNEFTDDEIWVAIRKGHIDDIISTPTRAYDEDDEYSGPWVTGIGLDKWVENGGTNFSVGQRQLVSLCRALLWKRKILILDEATANVDTKTDQIMQQVIREEFSDCTILTIAHRLRTVMDSDRILVMDQGKVAEFDSPANLLAQDSLFKSLVESMEINEAHNLNR